MGNAINISSQDLKPADWAMEGVNSLAKSDSLVKRWVLSPVAAELSSLPVAGGALIHLGAGCSKAAVALVISVLEIGLAIFGHNDDIANRLGISHYTAPEAAHHFSQAAGGSVMTVLLLLGGWTSQKSLVDLSRFLGVSKSPQDIKSFWERLHSAAVNNPKTALAIAGGTIGAAGLAYYSGAPQAAVSSTYNAAGDTLNWMGSWFASPITPEPVQPFRGATTMSKLWASGISTTNDKALWETHWTSETSTIDDKAQWEAHWAAQNPIPASASSTATQSPSPIPASASSTTTKSPSPIPASASSTTTKSPSPIPASASSTATQSPSDSAPSKDSIPGDEVKVANSNAGGPLPTVPTFAEAANVDPKSPLGKIINSAGGWVAGRIA